MFFSLIKSEEHKGNKPIGIGNRKSKLEHRTGHRKFTNDLTFSYKNPMGIELPNRPLWIEKEDMHGD